MKDDWISREQAKKFLYEEIERLHDDGLYDCFSRIIDDMYNELPSVTPQPKKGHWIVEVWTNREHHTCSVCQMVVDYEPCYHYCPYCGAEMESEE